MTRNNIQTRLNYDFGVYQTKSSKWLAMYDESHRFYHNWDHIEDVMEYAGDDIKSDEVFIAILFHDIIYDPKRKDNELRSAEFFLENKSEFRKLSPKSIENVYNAILDTRHNGTITTETGKIVCAADLHELVHGDVETLVKNEEKIFKEFQCFDWTEYKQGRIQFLESFMHKNPSAIEKLIEIVRYKTPRIGVFAGTFNPFHVGHLDVLHKAEKIFDKVIIAQGKNSNKNEDLCEELPWSLRNRQHIVYETLPELLESFSYDVTLIRGLRNDKDFFHEKSLKSYLDEMNEVECNEVLILCDKRFDHVSSSVINELIASRLEEEADKYIVK